MKKKLATLALSSILLCSLGSPTLAAEKTPSASPAAEHTDTQLLPDSQLYYGEIKAILTGENGAVTGLHMDSDQSGEYIMKISDKTFWIDSGKQTPSSPTDLTVGERIYVFHSSVSTRSMPPQSAAYAIVRNIPQDTGCAKYHRVEAAEEMEGQLQITTDNGGLFLYADKETTLSTYTGNSPVGLEEIKPGSYIMAWYDVVALSYPGQAHPQHIMLLDQTVDFQPLTRSALVVLLHTAHGSPVVNYAMHYSDVDQSASYAEAIRWASSEHLISGYSDGRVGPGDAVSREQMVVIFWRLAGSPMVTTDLDLSNYTDEGDISKFAQPALVWANQKGLLPAGNRLGPKDTVSLAEAEAMLLALGK